jgi:hypothetical protein
LKPSQWYFGKNFYRKVGSSWDGGVMAHGSSAIGSSASAIIHFWKYLNIRMLKIYNSKDN